MKKIKKLVFATNNLHKLEEARQIISDDFEIVSLSDINCHDDIPETSDTLQGNALIKARWVKDKYGYDCFADDTGLMVDALGGAPGVMSARYAGEHCSPADNVAKLLAQLKDEKNREAHFSTTVALIADGEEHLFEGRVDGEISHEPHGEGGFGYDPIFIEKESGKCFAEMTPEEKNAVSHRGRAMRKLRDFLGVFVAVVVSMIMSFHAKAEQWRLHPSFDGQIVTIADSPKFVYFLGVKELYNPNLSNANTLKGVLFRYDKDNDEMTNINASDLLSSNTVKAIAYNYDKKYLAVGVDDGTVTLLYDDGTSRSINGLKYADSSLDRTINDITFDNETGKIYVATNFGFITLDEIKGEVDTSRIFNMKINSVAKYKDRLWLGTEDGMYYGNPSNFSITDFERVNNLDKQNVSNLSVSGSQCYFTLGKGTSLWPRYLFVSGSYVGQAGIDKVPAPVYAFQRAKDAVVISSAGRIDYLKDENLQTIRLDDSKPEYSTMVAGTDNGSSYWIGGTRKGFQNLKYSDGKVTVLQNWFFPNASSAFISPYIVYSPNHGMLVRNHGNDLIFGLGPDNTYDLISGYKDMNWNRLSAIYRVGDDMPALLTYNPFGLAIDPNNPDHVYSGSDISGLLRLDLSDAKKSVHYSKQTDMLGGYGKPGFAVIAPENPSGWSWVEQCLFATPSFDSYGNLWTAYVNPEMGQDVSSYTEFWIWPAAARAASTNASNVQGWKKIKIKNAVTSNHPVMWALNSSSNKNYILHSGNNVDGAVILYDHRGTIDDTTDDRMVTIKETVDQDGNRSKIEYIYSIYEDKSTGLVWVSTNKELFTFNPTEAFTNPGSVRRIKVARNDGTNLADYLLSGITVNNITGDPSGRKWFATTGAGLVCTSSDGREILATYTKDNSDIPGDNVYGICYNPSNGSMMVSTDEGLCELFLDGSVSSDSSNVRAYPNPVRPDYFGYVTIDGLPQDAYVKIVDTAGNLIKECGEAFNGSVEWDVTNMFLKRVPGGVYFIVATNGPDSDSYNKVGKILVVN